jgi:hypothetical protein
MPDKNTETDLLTSKQFWISLMSGATLLLGTAGYTLKDSQDWANALWMVASGVCAVVSMVQGIRGARGPAEKVTSVAGKPVGDGGDK